MNRRLRRGLACCALTAAALTAPTLLGGASTTVVADTAWGNPPADGGTITTPALPVPVTGSVTVPTLPPVGPLDTAWG
jgi:hypothetical protein